jgi:hypothetical protein
VFRKYHGRIVYAYIDDVPTLYFLPTPLEIVYTNKFLPLPFSKTFELGSWHVLERTWKGWHTPMEGGRRICRGALGFNQLKNAHRIEEPARPLAMLYCRTVEGPDLFACMLI